MNDRLPSRTGPSAAREAARILGRLFAFWAALTLVAAAPAAAAEPLPTKEVAPGVFVYEAPIQLIAPSNEGAIANVGFVVGRDAVAVIDTGNSRIAGKRLLAAVRARTALPIRYVVNTHMIRGRRLCAIRWRITSVSEVDWQMAPAFTSSRRSVSALVKFPLWATASPPASSSANSGWTFRRMVSPVVE